MIETMKIDDENRAIMTKTKCDVNVGKMKGSIYSLYNGGGWKNQNVHHADDQQNSWLVSSVVLYCN